MSLILNLPQDIINILLTEWLLPLNLVLMDSVVCNSTARSSLHQVYSALPPINIPDVDFMKINRPKFLNWSFCRSIPLRRLLITQNLFTNGRDFHCQIIPFYIVEISLSLRTMPQAFGDIINQCVNLTSIRARMNPDLICFVCPAIMQNLTSINLFCGVNETMFDALAHVKSHCFRLKHLILDMDSYLKDGSAEINLILQQNPMLETIYCFSDVHCIDIIKTHCTKTRSLLLEVYDHSSCIDSTLSSLFSACPQLEDFCLTGGVGPFIYRVEREKEGSLALYVNCQQEVDSEVEVFCRGWVQHLLQLIPEARLVYVSLPFNDTDIAVLLRHAYKNRLHSLHLCDCVYLSVDLFQQLYLTFRGLTSLTLHNLFFNCDELLPILQLSQSCVLSELEVQSSLVGFALSSVMAIIRHCTELNKFFVTGPAGLPPVEELLPIRRSILTISSERKRTIKVQLWYQDTMVSFDQSD